MKPAAKPQSRGLDLRELASEHYVRWSYDPIVDVDGEGRRSDPYLVQIAGKRGWVYPFDVDTGILQVDLNDETATGHDEQKLARIEGLERAGHYSWRFTAQELGAVLKVIKPRKRRRVSESERQRLAEMGRAVLSQISAT